MFLAVKLNKTSVTEVTVVFWEMKAEKQKEVYFYASGWRGNIISKISYEEKHLYENLRPIALS